MKRKTLNMLRVLLLVYLLTLPFTSLVVYGQDAKLQLGKLSDLEAKASEVVDVTLDGKMLQMASKFLSTKRSSDEAKAKELINGLKGIYVKSYEFEKEGQYSAADIDSLRAQLQSPGWQRLVGVRSKKDGEKAEVYIMTSGDNILGLAIIASEPKELTVVNIVGPIDINKLSDLEGNFGIPSLGFEKDKKSGKE